MFSYLSKANFEVKSDKHIAKEIKHIGVPPSVRGHLAVLVNSPIVPVAAMNVTIPTKMKKTDLAFELGSRCPRNALIILKESESLEH